MGKGCIYSIYVCKHGDLQGGRSLNLFVDGKISRWHQGPLEILLQNKTWVRPIAPLGHQCIRLQADPSNPGE